MTDDLLDSGEIALPADICRSWEAGIEREWLVTNGLGGYASGTVAGANTRRYHGLLMAALQPPVRRTLLVAKLDEELAVDGRRYCLGANEYADGTIDPRGYQHAVAFGLDGAVPVFTYHAGGCAIEKRVFMRHGHNTTCVLYRLAAGHGPVEFTLLPLVTHREDHHLTHGSPDWRPAVDLAAWGCTVTAWPGATPVHIAAGSSVLGPWSLGPGPLGASTVAQGPRPGTIDRPAVPRCVPTGDWYWRFLHRVERERGLDAVEDLYQPVRIEMTLEPGDEMAVVLSTEPPDRPLTAKDVRGWLEEERARERELVSLARRQNESARGGRRCHRAGAA